VSALVRIETRHAARSASLLVAFVLATAWAALPILLLPPILAGADPEAVPGAAWSPAKQAVEDWALATTSGEDRARLLSPQAKEEARAVDPVQGLAQLEATRVLLALPPEQARRELAPLWERLRDGSLTLEELPGGKP
jgi:hypothetical protein